MSGRESKWVSEWMSWWMSEWGRMGVGGWVIDSLTHLLLPRSLSYFGRSCVEPTIPLVSVFSVPFQINIVCSHTLKEAAGPPFEQYLLSQTEILHSVSLAHIQCSSKYPVRIFNYVHFVSCKICWCLTFFIFRALGLCIFIYDETAVFMHLYIQRDCCIYVSLYTVRMLYLCIVIYGETVVFMYLYIR